MEELLKSWWRSICLEGAICNSVLGDGFRWIGWLLDAAGEGEAGEGSSWRRPWLEKPWLEVALVGGGPGWRWSWLEMALAGEDPSWRW